MRGECSHHCTILAPYFNNWTGLKKTNWFERNKRFEKISTKNQIKPQHSHNQNERWNNYLIDTVYGKPPADDQWCLTEKFGVFRFCYHVACKRFTQGLKIFACTDLTWSLYLFHIFQIQMVYPSTLTARRSKTAYVWCKTHQWRHIQYLKLHHDSRLFKDGKQKDK